MLSTSAKPWFTVVVRNCTGKTQCQHADHSCRCVSYDPDLQVHADVYSVTPEIALVLKSQSCRSRCIDALSCLQNKEVCSKIRPLA